MKPPAVFRFTTGMARPRHPWPAQIGDLDADDVVHCLDCDRDRLAGGTRAAVPDAVGEKLVHQQGSYVPARVPRPEYPVHKRASDPRAPPAPQESMVSRTAPVISATALPCPNRPGEVSGPLGGRTQGCTLDSAARVKPGPTASAARP